MIRTHSFIRFVAAFAGISLFGAVACAQNKPIFDMTKATNMTHAQHVKLLGKPIETHKSTAIAGNPLIYSRWHNKDFVWLRINYRNGKPAFMSALMVAQGRVESVQGLMKALNLSLGKDYGKTIKGYAEQYKTRGPSVAGTPFNEVFLRRSQLNEWDREKDTTEKLKLPKGTYFWKIRLAIDETKRNNIANAR